MVLPKMQARRVIAQYITERRMVERYLKNTA
jgi:hypothetical protein